jgi:leucyl aminopeptidase
MIQVQFVNQKSGDESCARAFIAFEGQGPSDLIDCVEPDLQVPARLALSASRFSGKSEQVLECFAASHERASRLLFAGAGALRTDNDLAMERAGGSAYRATASSGSRILELDLSRQSPAQAAHAAFGVCLAAYRFDKYRTTETSERKPSLGSIRVLVNDPSTAMTAFAHNASLAEAIYFARDLVSEPPNVLFPAEFASRVKALEHLGLRIEVLGVEEMRRLKMGALLAVGQGSSQESQLVIIRWNGGSETEAPLAFIGKGVCFDSGGLTLKEGTPMVAMKRDMAGAAAVVGAMQAIAARKARVNALGILALVENMPDGNAYRPSDIVTSMSGQTIEIISTDAEGRLILADALWFCQQQFKPQFMIDLATLTGAVHAALGSEYAGLFCNNDQLAQQLLAAAEREGEPLWRLPMPPKHGELMESAAADMINHTDRLLGGGAITGALFLQRFVNGYPWAHLDITGTAWFDASPSSIIPKGASGYGVRLLDRLVMDHFERP